MRRFILADLAEQDLDLVWLYLARESSEQVADIVLKKIRNDMRRLVDFPFIGHHRDDLPDPALRAWSVYSYLIVYRPFEDGIEVARVIHGAQDIPHIF